MPTARSHGLAQAPETNALGHVLCSLAALLAGYPHVHWDVLSKIISVNRTVNTKSAKTPPRSPHLGASFRAKSPGATVRRLPLPVKLWAVRNPG